MKKAKKPSSPRQPSSKQTPPEAVKPLNDEELDQVSGGIRFAEADVGQVAGGTSGQITQDITVNKAKTADKAYTQMDGYIKQ